MPLSSRPRAFWIAVGAAVATVVAVGFYLLLAGDDFSGNDTPATAGRTASPLEASRDDLEALSAELGHPIYWAGEQEGRKLELTTLPDGQVYVRYLGEDDPLGDPNPDFLAIGTYPVEEAVETLEQLAEREGSREERLEAGAIAVRTELASNSVYVAYPGEDVQIEVYDPDPDRALDVATSGALVPVE